MGKKVPKHYDNISNPHKNLYINNSPSIGKAEQKMSLCQPLPAILCYVWLHTCHSLN